MRITTTGTMQESMSVSESGIAYTIETSEPNENYSRDVAITIALDESGASIDTNLTTAKFSWNQENISSGTENCESMEIIDEHTVKFMYKTAESIAGSYYLGMDITIYDVDGNVESVQEARGPYLIDSKGPEKPNIDDHTSDGEWTRENVTISVSSYDSHSGINAIEYKYGEEGEWTTLQEWDDLNDIGATAGDILETSKTWSEESNSIVYFRAIDNFGNTSEVTTSYVRIDRTEPTISISQNSNTTWSKTASVDVTVSDFGSGVVMGLGVGPKLEYGWSESNTEAPTEYEEATANAAVGNNIVKYSVSASGLTGKYYLWVKPVSVQDVVGNTQTTNVVSTGTFYLDNTAPTLTLLEEGNTTWSQTASVFVEIEDLHSALAEGMSIKYGWSESNTEAPSEYVEAITTYAEGNNIIVFTASASGLTGKYYLWVVPSNLSDTAGNVHTENKISEETYYLDNMKPAVGTLTMKLENSEGTDYTNDTWTNKDVYIAGNNGTDEHSGEVHTTFVINKGIPTNKPTTLTETGTYQILVITTDAVGNCITDDAYVVKIDKELPTAGTLTMKLENNEGSDYTNDTWTKDSVYICVNEGIDETAGHNKTTYTINGGEELTEATTLTESGTYEIIVKTTDNASNTAQETYTVKIDKELPTAGTLIMKLEDSNGEGYENGTWTNKAIYLKADDGSDNDGGSGHAETTFIINGGEEQKETTLAESGEYEIIVKTTDNVGNSITSEKYIVNIDKTVPIPGTLIMKKESSTGEDYENDTWTNKSVYITLVDGTDNETGHKQTTYSINGGEELTEPTTITMVGIHEILVKTEDKVGNISSRTYLVKIDKAAPILGTLTMKLEDANGENYINGTTTNKNVYIKPNNGMDENSGHNETTYTINGGEVQTGENILTETRTYEIVLTTTDNAGNSRTAQYTIKIDKVAPIPGTLIIRQGDSQGPVYIQDTWINQNTYVEVVNGSDAESGHKETVYIIDGGEPQTEPTIITSDGKHEIIVKTTDIAGNTSTNTYIVQIDKMVPTISGITGNRKNTSTDPVILSINGAEDYGIGLAEEPYSFDGGKTWQTENTKKYIENTTGIIIQVKDKLGNIYTYHEKINITSIIVVLVELQIEKLPTKTEYLPHENFSREGMVVKAIYSNGTTTETRNYEVVNQSDLNCLTTEVLIRSNENYEVETTCPISVAHEMQDPNCMEPSICKTEGCSHTEGEALGHEFTNYVSNNDANCTKNGTETAVCNREGCEAQFTREDEDSMLDHYYASVIIRETCTEDGYTKHTCIHCQYEYKDNYTDKFGHEFTNYVSDNNATCTSDGTKTAICNREICNETNTITDKGTKLPHTYAEEKCTVCGAKEIIINVTSEKYTIEDIYIKNIPDKTKVKDFIANIESEAEEIRVVNEDDEEIGEDKNVGTGMILSLKVEGEEKIFKLVVAGDATGDGKADFSDIIKINKHRLKKSELYGEYLMAADVNGDGKADFSDITKINKYRLNKITQLVSK